MSERWGARGRVGIIYPASGRHEQEMNEFAPPSVSLHLTRVHIPLRETGEFEGAAVSYPDLRRGAKEIAAVDPACIVWPCTSENVRRGVAGEREQASAIAAMCSQPVVTAASSVTAALNHLGAKRIGLGGPYRAEVVAALADYFGERGVRVLSRISLGLSGDRQICALLPADTEALAKSADHAEADAVFISCGSMRIRPVLAAVERALGKPVLTTTMAVMWNTLRAIGITAPLAGMGRLFASAR